MQSKATTVEDYINELPKEKREAITKLRKVIKKNLPKGFSQGMGYGMMGYSVPHSLYPDGYHCDPKLPLPFMGLASQKHFIAVYHMGVYADPKLLKWFTDAHAKAGVGKLDMGKSCIRFKKPENISYALIGELASKITPRQWIKLYEKKLTDGRRVKNKTMKKLIFALLYLTTLHSFAQDTSKVKMKEWPGILTLTEKYQDEKNWTKDDEAIVGEHFQRLIKMKNEGVVILAGRTQTELNDTDGMGLVIFYAKDEKEALQFIMNDPAVKNNIMLGKVLPYGIAINKCN